MSTAVRTSRTTKDVLVISAITATILLMFPVLALTGLALQFGFVIALPVAVAALLLVPLIRRMRAPDQTVEVQGIGLPGGLYLHERHGWARRSRGGRYLVGADQLLLTALSAVDHIDLPKAGTHVDQGAPLVTLRSGDRELTLKAPFAGTVQRVNEAVSDKLSVVQSSPYDKGWLAELTPTSGVRSLNGLRDSATARPWLTHEIDRMVALVSGTDEATVLADGGRLDPGFATDLDDDTWKKLADSLF